MKKPAKSPLTTEQRKAQAKKAWDTIRARKAGTMPPAPAKGTTSKDEQIERLNKLLAQWFSDEPLPVQESLGTEPAVAPEVPVATPEVIVTPAIEPKKGRKKAAAPKVETIDIEPAKPEAPAPVVDLLDSIVADQSATPAPKKGRRKAA